MIEISPETKCIFAASALEDRLKGICRRISIAPERAIRLELLKEAEGVLAEMRQLTAQDFSRYIHFILDKLKGMELEIRTLAELPLGFEGDGICSVCGDPFLDVSGRKVCLHCIEPILEYFHHLESGNGFGTMFI